MGTTLTGTTPQDTYDSLIKVTDNGPLSGSLKTLTDGLGNDSALALSTGAASITGTLAVSGNAAFDTNTLFVDAAANEVGIGTTSPSGKLHISATSGVASLGSTALAIRDSAAPDYGFDFTLEGVASGDMSLVRTELDVQSQVMTFKRSNGNVGIGTSSPSCLLQVLGVNTLVASTGYRKAQIGGAGNWGSGSYEELGIGFSGIRSIFTGGDNWDLILAAGTSTAFAAGTQPERLRITSAGVVELAQGQIKFPATQVASADPNTLDDYEEGTWTMGVSFGGASVGVTYSANTGTYTKIGRQVTVNGNMTLTSKGSSTGLARITGLPFVIGSGSSYSGIASVNFEDITFTGQFQPIASVGDTVIVPQFVTEAGVNNNTSDANFSNTSRIAINFTYFV